MKERHFFARIRPTLTEGPVYIRADVKKQERGRCEKLAYWRISPRDKARWE
jgi:hypothetical protein